MASTAAAQKLNPSQAAVLAECQQLWAISLTRWDTGGECGAVDSVECDSHGMITAIYFEDQPLDGPLPDAIGNLTSLTNLTLSMTNLSGSIPLSFSRLTRLEHLTLSRNLLSGSIPLSFSRLTRLQNLDLGFNIYPGITGSIPQALSTLKNLQLLDLGYNALTGSYPSWLSSLSKLSSMCAPSFLPFHT
ncbi:unnamed protein product [Closterium sp. NIES-65]|nr:unnamed protein product [Closterium sp. NIES-65]